ncbi:MAG: hypothetical protein KDN05_05590 [Verrucomicrobiae bacterium]|nr:hypothetical protein [Verrucomicrobiae bacterium]MCP5532485.1 hypothetical protein [Akkermansiaceae bacterium]MCP5545750.1 hypothetical protein [Akkermansiaceae bacterium]
MITSDDNSGVFTFLAGMVLLVFVAVGLSLLIDKRFQFSSSDKRLKADLANSESELTFLRERQRSLSAEHDRDHPARVAMEKSLAASLAAVSAGKNDLKDLATRKKSLEEEIGKLGRDFETTREETRLRIWREATGEEIGILETRDGRRFEGTVISKVTPAGLEIRHRNGIARLEPAHLSEELRDRFQWVESERAAVLAKEQRHRNEIATAGRNDNAAEKPERRVRRRRQSSSSAGAASPEIARLRSDLIAWQGKVSRIQTDRNEAAVKRYGSDTSVPGSLETWDARYYRLTLQLEKANEKLAAARANLAAKAPDDPLLRPTGRSR